MYREYGQVVAVTNRSLTERPFLEQIRRVCEMHPDASTKTARRPE